MLKQFYDELDKRDSEVEDIFIKEDSGFYEGSFSDLKNEFEKYNISEFGIGYLDEDFDRCKSLL